MDVRGKSDRARAVKKLLVVATTTRVELLLFLFTCRNYARIRVGLELIVDLCILYAILE